MRDALDLFRETDTRDELGIGSVRDAFADILFPGTSTIQTRVRYFLFVPWMYQRQERHAMRSAEFARRARREEIALIDTLLKSRDTQGIIGKRARAGLQRLPSNIYWQGLGAWGIRLFPGAQDSYHRMQDSPFPSSNRQSRRTDDGNLEDGIVPYSWHPGLPPAPEDFPTTASFQLTVPESTFLRERLLARVPDTLLAWLVDHSHVPSAVTFPWAHPQYAAFPAHIREQLAHGRIFSEVMHGAALLYNLMLAEQGNWPDLADEYHDALLDWAAMLEQRQHALSTWEPARMWHILDTNGARIPLSTRGFVHRWANIVYDQERARTLAANEQARTLIHERERVTKKKQARLDNQRALELWSGSSGTARLDYRWSVAQRLITDIIAGFETGANYAASTGQSPVTP